MANPKDNTNLGTGEIVASEAIEDEAGFRRDPNLPDSSAGVYKIPRSKIAVGSYGKDDGDATHDNPLPVESREERRRMELAALRDREESLLAYCQHHEETPEYIDRRGHHISTRGAR